MQTFIEQIAAHVGATDQARLERVVHAVCAAAPEVFKKPPPPLSDDPPVLLAALPSLPALESIGAYFERHGFDEPLFRAVEAVANDASQPGHVRAAAARSIVRSRAPALMTSLIAQLWNERAA